MPINQEEIVKIIERSLPSVVSITSYEKSDKDLNYFSENRSKTDTIIKKMLKRETKCGGGSGFIVTNDGIVVTAMHVISNRDMDYTVTLNNGENLRAKKIGTDIINDIAFLKIDSVQKFNPLPLGDSLKLKLGESVIAIGNALGIFRNTVSKGIISGLSRSINASNEEIEENLSGLIQTDAAINPGNSGGPLINIQGKVIGINSASVAQAENIGFAIPINTIIKDLEKIRKFGNLKRPFLGIRYININPHIKKIFNIEPDSGVLVVSPDHKQKAVIKDSPAEKAGIKEKDIIISIDGLILSPEFSLEQFLEKSSSGQKINIKIIRHGKLMDTQARLAEM